MKKAYTFILYAALVLAIAAIATFVFFRFHGKKQQGASGNNPGASAPQAAASLPWDGTVLVSADDGIKKIDLATGQTHDASALQQEDFSGFAGLPKLGDDGKQDTEQADVLVSRGNSQAIVTVTAYADDASQSVVSSDDYVCDIAGKSCQKTDLLDQNYQGLDPQVQKNPSVFAWEAWDSAKNTLFGHLTTSDAGDVSPVYACDTQAKTCAETQGYDSQKPGDEKAVVPQGAFSPSLSQFVLVNQHDDPNNTTGKNWDLLLYSSSDCSKPTRSYDITVAIDRDPSVPYDSVYAVAWSNDEKTLAIGTTSRIFVMNLDSGSLKVAYVAPPDDNGDATWDTSALFLSPDGATLAFVDSSPVQPDSASTDQQASGDTLNALKKIDLAHGNVVGEVTEAQGLALKLQ